MANVSKDAALRLAAGRAVAGEKFPYLRTALFAMAPVITGAVKTCAVDRRWRMYANPDFVLNLTVEEVAGAWLHELGHVINKHAERWTLLMAPERHHPLYNTASDAAINETLRDAGTVLPPTKAYFWEHIPGARRGMTAEQMYRLLLDTPAATELTRHEADLVLLPDRLRAGHGPGTKIAARSRRGIFAGHTTVTIVDDGGRTVFEEPSAKVHDLTTISFDLRRSLPGGIYEVSVTCGTDSAQARLSVTAPSITLLPDNVVRGYRVPSKITIAGDDTRFADGLAVAVLDADGKVIPSAVTEVQVVSAQHVDFRLAAVPDGLYTVRATTSREAYEAALPVGVPGTTNGVSDLDGTDASDPQESNVNRGELGQENQGDGNGEQRDDCGSGSGGSQRPWEKDGPGDDVDDGSVSEGRAEMIRRQVAKEIKTHQQGIGNVPAGWLRFADEVLTPRVDWRRELHSVVSRARATIAGLRDYTFARVSRRASSTPGIALPAMRQPRPPRLDIVIDTSASVSNRMLAQVKAEIKRIVKHMRGENVRVFSCDVASTSARRVRRIEDIELVGGGGTDMRVGLAASAALRPRADIVIVATDGDTPWDDIPPDRNPQARYVTLLLDGDRDTVPPWMRKIIVAEPD
ncbi:hypothetical protein AWW66_09985 [Micromonospora rosaria]|uniref:Metallopeptidase domain-containing protein n=1 Tax=Micromonospora rosaria TaxID=47874 RepID=A0A136PUN6_9ACTN|nr:VWA-like domain-containing protein [Micromonospora rosaria]KXK62158.1 hypothetical protein AWW66_09985 [Micromonospora rosaria]